MDQPVLSSVTHPEMAAHLQRVVGDRVHLVVASSGAELAELAGTSNPRGLIVGIIGTASTAEMAAIRALTAKHAHVPSIAYATLAASSIRSVIELSQAGLRHVVLFRLDDRADYFRGILATIGIIPTEEE